MTNDKKCSCFRPYNFRAEYCEYCGIMYNGNEPRQASEHFLKCEKARSAIKELSKEIISKMTPEELESFKNFGKKK